jgi:hypothetical protein
MLDVTEGGDYGVGMASKSRELMRASIARDREAARDRIRGHTKVDPDTACWVWQRSRHIAVYGQLGGTVGGVSWSGRAHVFAYEAFVGPVPDGLIVRHRCDVRTCCNPDHLEVGTKADNSRDMVERGRSSVGARNPNAKLNKRKVTVIHKLHAEGLTQREIATVVGCSCANVCSILNGRTWGHVV